MIPRVRCYVVKINKLRGDLWEGHTTLKNQNSVKSYLKVNPCPLYPMQTQTCQLAMGKKPKMINIVHGKPQQNYEKFNINVNKLETL